MKAHTIAGRALGITQEMVDSIPRAAGSPLFSEEEQAALAMAIELTKKAELSNETFDRVAKHFSDPQLLELVVNIGAANLTNRVTDAFWADIEEQE